MCRMEADKSTGCLSEHMRHWSEDTADSNYHPVLGDFQQREIQLKKHQPRTLQCTSLQLPIPSRR